MRRGCGGAGLFAASGTLLKKSGKPTDVKEYKQVYLPYEGEAPSKADLERERRKFMHCPALFTDGTRRMMPVVTVPDNMYTFGKEGMSIPIAIFKDQQDPVIAPEWTYPGIYENKIAGQVNLFSELADLETKTPPQRSAEAIVHEHTKLQEKGKAPRGTDGPTQMPDNSGFASPFQKDVLDKQVFERLAMVRIRVGLAKLAHKTRYDKERAATKVAVKAAGAKAPAAAAKNPDGQAPAGDAPAAKASKKG